jgi:hypothetical protein
VKGNVVGHVTENRFVRSFQNTPAGPSDKSGVKANTLEWLEVVACDKGRGILIF